MSLSSSILFEIESPLSKPFFRGRIPLPPGINQSYKIIRLQTKDGQDYETIGDTEEAAHFKEAALWELKQASVRWDVVESLQQNKQKAPLSVHIKFFFPTLWKRDIDGGIKAAVDAVFKHLGLNDNLVTHLSATKDSDRDDPRVEIEVRCVLQQKG